MSFYMNLQKSFKGWKKNIKSEIKSHKLVYILLALILLGGLFFRTYRTEALLRFYYDQGRDALVIWRFWHEGKLFLIGPVTGLHGIFLGPFYYYLIAPFYLISGGSPVLPALFLAFLNILAIIVIYFLGWQMNGRVAGIIAAAISSFSYYLVLAGRWLANPTPLLFTSALLLLAMWLLVSNSKKVKKWVNQHWYLIAILVGISLQFEAASAVFYIPSVFVFLIYIFYTNKASLPTLRGFFIASGLFLITLLPQILFNFRHDNLLYDGFKRVLVEEKSFQSPFTEYNLIKKRDFLWDVFSSKIFPGIVRNEKWYYYVGFLGVFLAFIKNPKPIILLITFIGIPLIGYLFFQGNYGNIYDYYLTGYYLPMVLLFSIGLGFVWKNILGKIFVLVFFIVFLNLSLRLDKNLVVAGVDGPTHVTLGNQLQSVDWVFEDANGEFNVDVYVPPVIPHTYDYLFLWQGNRRCGGDLCGLKKDKNVDIVYTLYEVDPPHPERLNAWLARYEKITKIDKEIKFGGITVQKRIRLND